MVTWLDSYGTASFNEAKYPKPAAVIMQYTGHEDYTENDPPTLACVGDNDWIADQQTMAYRLKRMSALGIDTEFHHYPGLSHGFGLGTGTVAKGLIDQAITFWENHMT